MEQRLRAGRISNDERLIILYELGTITQERFNMNLVYNSSEYDLELLQGSLQFAPDVDNFQNTYWIDAGNDKLNEIANYFEFGTGIYNTKTRRGPIVPINAPVLWFRKPWNGKQAFMSVKGVKPVFMMTKAVKSVENERESLQRDIRLKYRLAG